MSRVVGRRRSVKQKLDAPTQDGAAVEEGETGGGAEVSPPVFVGEEDAADGMSPLDVMLQTMRSKWQRGDHEGAVTLARQAAPYVHPKASAGREGGSSPIQGLSDAELDLIVRGSAAGRGDSGTADQEPDQEVAGELGEGGAGGD
jgi:hypothetical protein